MKTAIVLFLAAVVAVATATECDQLTRLKVKAQWTRAYSTGNDRENFVQAVWRAYANQPALKPMFGGYDVHSGEFKSQASRIMSGLDIAISLLDQPEALAAQLKFISGKHIERKIPDSSFLAFRAALGHVLPAQLGRCYDREAWKACFEVIANGVKGL